MAKLGEAAADLTAQMPHCHALCQARGLCNSDDCLCISAEPLAIAQLGQGHPLRCDTLGKLDVHRAKRGGGEGDEEAHGSCPSPKSLVRALLPEALGDAFGGPESDPLLWKVKGWARACGGKWPESSPAQAQKKLSRAPHSEAA